MTISDLEYLQAFLLTDKFSLLERAYQPTTDFERTAKRMRACKSRLDHVKVLLWSFDNPLWLNLHCMVRDAYQPFFVDSIDVDDIRGAQVPEVTYGSQLDPLRMRVPGQYRSFPCTEWRT